MNESNYDKLLKKGSKVVKSLTICQSCNFPTVKEVEQDVESTDETLYYCSTCEVWHEGTPIEEEYTLKVVG